MCRLVNNSGISKDNKILKILHIKYSDEKVPLPKSLLVCLNIFTNSHKFVSKILLIIQVSQCSAPQIVSLFHISK